MFDGKIVIPNFFQVTCEVRQGGVQLQGVGDQGHLTGLLPAIALGFEVAVTEDTGAYTEQDRK